MFIGQKSIHTGLRYFGSKINIYCVESVLAHQPPCGVKFKTRNLAQANFNQLNVFVEKKFFVWINKIQPHSSLPLRSTKDAKKRISITILLRILSSSKAKPILSFTVVKLIRSYKNLLRQIFEQNHEQNFCFFPKKERINFRNLRKKVIFSSIFAELQA